MLLSYTEIKCLLEDGVVENADPELINSSSLDIRLGPEIFIETFQPGWKQDINIAKKEVPGMNKIDLTTQLDNRYSLKPGEFILAHSVEKFNLPNTISAEYKLKSSMARCGLEHLNAGWCDSGWHGSNLTLEFVNILNRHNLVIEAGMKIGQVVFFRHLPVPVGKGYDARGQYNDDEGVQQSKGLK